MAKAKKQELTMEEKLEQAFVPESEWPYEVPGNWVWVKFGCLAKDMADGPFGSNLKREHYTVNREVRIIQLSNIGEDGWRDENTKYTTYEHAKTISRSVVNSGEIVIAKMMPAGRAIKVPNEEKVYILSSDAVKFVPKNLLNTDYLLYAINSDVFRNQVSAETQGITRARTSIGKMKTYAFPLAPLAEQQRIVDRIESLFAKLDQAKELAQNALDTFESRKAVILHKAFTGELTAKWREKHGVGMESWKEKTLKHLAEFRTGYAFDSNSFTNNGYQVIRMGNLYNGILDLTRNPVFISPDTLNNSIIEKYLIRTGDILLTLTGTKYKRDYGYAVLIDEDKNMLLNQRIVSLTPEIVEPNLLLYYLRSDLFRDVFFSNETGGVNQGNVSSKFVENIVFPYPPLLEQQEIVRILDSLFEKEQKAKELCDVIDKIDLMKKAILARAFRGELGTNDPSEESAIELLKEILINSEEDIKNVKRIKSVKIDPLIENELKTNIEREIYILLLKTKQTKINDLLFISKDHFEITQALNRMEKIDLIENTNGLYSINEDRKCRY